MKQSTLSELVASDMNARLASDEHKSLFRGVFASEEAPEVDVASADDKEDEEEKDCSMADDAEAEDADDNEADDVSMAFDTAVASLLTASAALDVVGFEKAATMSVNLATLVVEAAKKAKDSKKKDSKKSDKKDSKDSKKDSKKSDKKDSKKDPKKDSKKDSKPAKKSGK